MKSLVLPNLYITFLQCWNPRAEDRRVEHQSQCRVLIAEDNDLNRKVLLAFMERLGYACDIAVDGPEVLDRIQEHTYELILMDIRMPGLDGIEVTRRIREMNIPQPHILAVTASAMPDDGPEYSEAGLDGFLAKPLRMAQLEAALEPILGKTA